MTVPVNPDDPMPEFVLKGKDQLAPATIISYIQFCEITGLKDQAEQATFAYLEMKKWQERNPDKVKLPDHKHVPVTKD